MINRIVVGRGRNRQAFSVPSEKVAREKATEDMKDYVTRPKLFEARMKAIAS